MTMCDSNTSAASSTIVIRGRSLCKSLRYFAAPEIQDQTISTCLHDIHKSLNLSYRHPHILMTFENCCE